MQNTVSQGARNEISSSEIRHLIFAPAVRAFVSPFPPSASYDDQHHAIAALSGRANTMNSTFFLRSRSNEKSSDLVETAAMENPVIRQCKPAVGADQEGLPAPETAVHVVAAA